MTRILAVCACLFLARLGEIQAVAQTAYQFINVADSSGSFASFSPWPEINNLGAVAFQARLDSGVSGVFQGAGGLVSPIADSTGEFAGFGVVSINDSGQAAFNATYDVGGGGVFTGAGGAVSTIADTTGPFAVVMGASINNSGVVAFTAGSDSDPAAWGVYTGTGGNVATISDISGLFRAFDEPQINDAGVIVFRAHHDSLSAAGIYTSAGGPTTTIVEADHSLHPLPRINAHGTVVFTDFVESAVAIFTGNGGPVTPFLDQSGPFKALGSGPDINSQGTIVFNADLDNGKSGIYAGADPVSDKVIELGDSLFGSTLVQIGSYPRLNDAGDIVFGYELANGVTGIAVAKVVPEPGGAALVGCLLLMNSAQRKWHARGI